MKSVFHKTRRCLELSVLWFHRLDLFQNEFWTSGTGDSICYDDSAVSKQHKHRYVDRTDSRRSADREEGKIDELFENGLHTSMYVVEDFNLLIISSTIHGVPKKLFSGNSEAIAR